MARFGFVGVGMMGYGMAANLLKAGHAVTVMAHRNRQPVDDLVRRGAIEARSLPELAQGQDAIFLCVNGMPQVEATVAQLEPHLVAGQLIIDTGTSLPQPTVALAERLAARGAGLVDAPVTGGPPQAEAGELVFMVGATHETYERVRPWLQAMAKKVVRVGGTGAGAHAKLCNNFISVGQTALVIEAYRMARANGVDWATLYEIQQGGIAYSGSLERVIPPAIAGDFSSYKFALANCIKDFGYIAAVQEQSGGDTTLPGALIQYFEAGADRLGGDALLSALLAPPDPAPGGDD